MSQDKYRITSPTMAMLLEDGRHVAHMVPAGAVITIESETVNGNRLVEVRWGETMVMMSTQDLRSRGKKIE